MQTYTLPAPLNLTLTAQELADLLTTAFEGGIGYWVEAYTAEGYEPRRGASDRFGASHGIDHFCGYMAPLVGGTLTLTCAEGEVFHDLTTEKLLAGLALRLTPGTLPPLDGWADANDLLGRIDADDADVIVQLGLFGSVVYG